VAANSLGSASASAYLSVVNELPVDVIPSPQPKLPSYVAVIAIIVAILFVVGAGIVVWYCGKYNRKKVQLRQLERVNQWTKKVIVVQPCIDNNGTNSGDTLVS
jgi:hypothetical protein